MALGKVSVDHSSFTTVVSVHGGTGRKATKKRYKCIAILRYPIMLESASPSSFVTNAVIDEMRRRGAALSDMVTVGTPRRWGGFHDSLEALKTDRSACLSVQFFWGRATKSSNEAMLSLIFRCSRA